MSEKDGLSIAIEELNRTTEEVQEVMQINSTLKAENARLRAEAEDLRGKITVLEAAESLLMAEAEALRARMEWMIQHPGAFNSILTTHRTMGSKKVIACIDWHIQDDKKKEALNGH